MPANGRRVWAVKAVPHLCGMAQFLPRQRESSRCRTTALSPYIVPDNRTVTNDAKIVTSFIAYTRVLGIVPG